MHFPCNVLQKHFAIFRSQMSVDIRRFVRELVNQDESVDISQVKSFFIRNFHETPNVE